MTTSFAVSIVLHFRPSFLPYQSRLVAGGVVAAVNVTFVIGVATEVVGTATVVVRRVPVAAVGWIAPVAAVVWIAICKYLISEQQYHRYDTYDTKC
jgi:hypothetical protein